MSLQDDHVGPTLLRARTHADRLAQRLHEYEASLSGTGSGLESNARSEGESIVRAAARAAAALLARLQVEADNPQGDAEADIDAGP